MFNDELHLLQVNPWVDQWLSRPLYRGDVAQRGNVVELAALPALLAAEEASGWLYGKPAPHVLLGLREALEAHPESRAAELSSARSRINNAISVHISH